MHTNAFVRDILAAKPLTPSQAKAVLAQAETLQNWANPEDLRRGLLRGRRVGLMCLGEGSADARLFHRAASGLGAHVSYIQADFDKLSSTAKIDATAQMLGRLYDAVECQGMDPAVVRRLGAAATIPIYPGVACLGHPCLALAHELPGDATLDEKRAWLVQALLISSMD